MKKRREIAKNPPKQKINQKPEINQNLVVKPNEANTNLTKNNKFNPINDMGSETASKSENSMGKKAKKIGIAMIDPRKSPGLKMIKKMKNKTQNSFSCPECGAESNEDQKFCKKCGKQFSENNAPMDKKILKEYMLIRLGKKKKFSNDRSSKETKKLFGHGHFGRDIANKTRKRIKKGITLNTITRTSEIDLIIEEAVHEYKEGLKQFSEDIKKNQETRNMLLNRIKSEPSFTIIRHYTEEVQHTVQHKSLFDSRFSPSTGTIKKGFEHHTTTTETCVLDITEDRLKISCMNSNLASIHFKTIDSMSLYKERSKFYINKKNTKFSFVCEKPGQSEYTENLFNEIESKYKQFQSENQTEQILSQKVSNNEEDPINKIKKLNDLKEAGILTDEEFENKKKELLERI